MSRGYYYPPFEGYLGDTLELRILDEILGMGETEMSFTPNDMAEFIFDDPLFKVCEIEQILNNFVKLNLLHIDDNEPLYIVNTKSMIFEGLINFNNILISELMYENDEE